MRSESDATQLTSDHRYVILDSGLIQVGTDNINCMTMNMIINSNSMIGMINA